MKVYVVVTQYEGETTKEPGRVSTKIEHNQYLFAAESIDQVWDEANRLVRASGDEIVTIHEEHPSIVILGQ